MEVRSKETPESLVAKPRAWPRCRVRSRVERLAGPQHVRSLRKRRQMPPPFGWSRGCRADSATAKAMEDTSGSGAGVEGPSGVRGVERLDGCPGNWGGPPRPRRCGRREACRPITGDPGKWPVAERESEGVVVVTMGGTTQPTRSEGPLLHRRINGGERDSGECRQHG